MESCPACERKFEELEDYPVVYIERFSEKELPELITSFPISHYKKRTIFGRRKITPPIPKRVIELFDEGMKQVVYQGMVYNRRYRGPIPFLEDEGSIVYTSSKDVTNLVKEALNSSRIKDSLSKLESLVGREIRTSELSGLFKFSIGVGDYDVSLLLLQHPAEKEENVNNGSRKCQICLGEWKFNTPIVPVAEFFYKGKIAI